LNLKTAETAVPFWIRPADEARIEKNETLDIMIKTITAITTTLLIAAAAATTSARAQDDEQAGPPKGKRRPGPPIVVALDPNRDGVIDATELANASAALAELDANNDGELTRDEIRPAKGRKGPRCQGKPCYWKGADGNAPKGDPDDAPAEE
jgi:hypothetical protein